MKTKNVLREKYRKVRDGVKSAEKDDGIFLRITESEVFKNAEAIFLYYSVRSEVDTVRIISSALDNGKAVALPRCKDRHGNMEFYLINDIEKSLIDGEFSLKEPDVSVCKKACFSKNAVCVVPALAFDREGFRLGYGGGYYDRFLSNFEGATVGLCYEECFCESLPHGEHDIKVDMIITDKKIYKTK